MNELARTTAYTSKPNNELDGYSTWAGRLLTSAKTTALLAPFVASGAFAQTAASTDLANEAKSQMTGVVALLIGILLVGIGISVLWFTNRHSKKAVNKS